MADVTFDVEVEGHAAESLDSIAASADVAGEKVEELSAKMRTIPDLKVDADIAGLEDKLTRMRAELDVATGTRRVKIEADIALAEAQLAGLRDKAQQTGAAMNTAALSSVAGWTSLIGLLVAASGYVVGLGAVFGGALGVGFLALHGLTGGFGELTSAAQSFRFELTTLQQTTLQDLARAAQEGFLPAFTAGLQAIAPVLDALQPSIKAFGEVLGQALSMALQILAPLTGGMLDFGRAALSSLSVLQKPLQDFVQQISAVFQHLEDTGQLDQAMQGFAAIVGGLLQLLPPLIQAAVALGAALSPTITTAVQALMALLTPLLNLISEHGRVAAVLVEVLGAWWMVSKAITALGLADWLGSATAAMVGFDAAADANPVGAIVLAVEALIALLVILVMNWDRVKEAGLTVAHAIGDAFAWLADMISKFFEAILAPFKALGQAWSSMVSGLGSVGTGFSMPGMASGGTVAEGGLSWVGENGPELRYMPKGASVIPLSQAGGGGGGDIHVHVNNAVIGNEAQLTATIRASLKTAQSRGHGFGFA